MNQSLKLSDESFGIKETRQFPLFDKDSLKSAIEFFRYCPDEHKKELAENINELAKKLDVRFKFNFSNPFLKYASKDIRSGVTHIEEFHIGQLSPITPLTNSTVNINFGKTKTTLEKLKKVWDNKNTDIDKKNIETSFIIKEAIEKDTPFTPELMLAIEESKNLYDILNPFVYNENDTFKRRSIEHDSQLYKLILNYNKEANIDDAIYAIKNIRNINILNAAITYINYSNIFTTKDEKNIINKAVMSRLETIKRNCKNFDLDLFYNNQLSIDSNFGIGAGYTFKDEDREVINKFDRLCNHHLYTRIYNIIKSKFKNKRIQEVLEPTRTHLLSKFTYDRTEFRLETLISKKYNSLHFIKCTNGDIYYATAVYLEKEPHYYGEEEYSFFIVLIKIHQPKENLLTDMIAYLSGANIPIKIIVKTIEINNRMINQLYESDFKSALNGINIDNGGNVSFLLNYDNTWNEKLNIIKDKIEKADSATTEYKNTMCYLYSLINILYNNYYYNPDAITRNGSLDVNDALDTLNKAITIFKNAINDKNKSFDFKTYFITSKYYEKINIPTDTKIENEVDRMYWLIMR